MTEEHKKPDIHKVIALPEEMRSMPREVRDVIEPAQLTGKDSFQFRCHPGVPCFNACCSHIDIVLTPYDIIRLRRRLGLSAEAFLYEYADPSFLRKGGLPVPLLAMNKQTGRCPFNTDAGCSVYEDRPVTCRYYPIGMALMHRQEAESNEEFYVLIKEDYCKGHLEDKRWTVDEWRADQGSDQFGVQNKGWIDMIVKRRSAGDLTKTSLPLSEMFYTASTNPEEFREFLFDSTFLKRYDVDEQTRTLIQEDDVALVEFGLNWLKSVLFGDPFMPLRAGVVEEVQQRQSEKKRAILEQRTREAAQELEQMRARQEEKPE